MGSEAKAPLMRTVGLEGTRVTYCSISPSRRMRGLLGELMVGMGNRDNELVQPWERQ